MDIFKTKSIDEVLFSTKKNKGLQKTLGVWNLILLALGGIIGTGIFGMTGIAAVNMSGPAVMVSYAIAGITTIFISLTYTEIAAMIPSSGGAYSYSFVAFGEIVAWMVSWMIILYFISSASTVASCWSGYMVNILHQAGINLPDVVTKIPSMGGIINLPATLVSLCITWVLIRGTKESTLLNGVLVFIKIAAIFLFIYVAIPNFDLTNWFAHNHPYQKDLLFSNPFMPFGISGVISGSAFVFFAYNGFDTIAAAAEEAKNPKRDLIIAILGSLTMCMILYMVVSSLLVGIVPFNLIDVGSPIPSALTRTGNTVVSPIIATGVVIGMVSVILAQLFALSRVILVVARDGLLPPFLAKIHPKYHTPHYSILTIGAVVSFLSGFVPLEVVGNLSSVGALFSFMFVCLAIIKLRYKYPDINRPFKCPAVYFVAIFGILMCLTLFVASLNTVGLYAAIWVVTGIVFYFIYYTMRVRQ